MKRAFRTAALLLALASQARAIAPGAQAPEFPAGLDWLNTAKPLTLKGLRGKVVLLDFWTFCCINCMHVLPDLARLEEKYKDGLVVVGVHSAKFSAEQASAKIRQAVLRYGVTHPVLNDHASRVWDLYGVQAWPTTVLLAPDGKVLLQRSGEGVYQALDGAIAAALKKYSGEIKRGPMPLRSEMALAKDTPLRFPGKLLADAAGGRLFVSDSGHGRVVAAGLKDGAVIFSKGPFKNPQGLALSADGGTLYVAETGGDALRAIDLKSGAVSTLAEGLNSPWDLALHEGILYIALAGAHQIWRMDLAHGKPLPWAGSGREGLKDGPLAEAELAQPSGLSAGDGELYSADSESSSLRAIAYGGKSVRTLHGKGLFDFGDGEGDASKARLQHPLGVHASGGVLYVADSYNNRIKALDLGGGKLSFLAGPAPFDEPGGLWAAEGKLYVADTNHHAVRVIDLGTRALSIFKFKGL
jgi:thiol-disulfide isomerase/thioredoxin